MRQFAIRTAVTAGLAVMASIPLVFGQGSPTLRVNVPFTFVAQDQNCPAGVYTFSRAQMQAMVTMTSADGKLTLHLPVVTALARSSEKDDHLLAFDKVEDKRVLSEVWLPERDGALVHVTPADHTHEIIRKASGGGGTR